MDRLQRIIDDLGVSERDKLRAEIPQLHREVSSLRSQRAQLEAELEPLRAEVLNLNGPRRELQMIIEQLNAARTEHQRLSVDIEAATKLQAERAQLEQEVNGLRLNVVELRESAILQEVGIYEYRHPLEDASAYKARLVGIRAQIKDVAKAGNAVKGATNWTVNGSATQGNKMVREFSKLMLRAYNAEADSAVRSMKPYTLESAIARLTKVRETIVRLGATMNIRVTDHYHSLQVAELELTADYLAKVAEEGAGAGGEGEVARGRAGSARDRARAGTAP